MGLNASASLLKYRLDSHKNAISVRLFTSSLIRIDLLPSAPFTSVYYREKREAMGKLTINMVGPSLYMDHKDSMT